MATSFQRAQRAAMHVHHRRGQILCQKPSFLIPTKLTRKKASPPQPFGPHAKRATLALRYNATRPYLERRLPMQQYVQANGQKGVNDTPNLRYCLRIINNAFFHASFLGILKHGYTYHLAARI
ncbi:MAG: hypothetical protein AAF601_02430 [Pseudomonadota bacterium]